MATMTKTSATQRGSKQAADKNAIRPFHVNFPEAELTELRRRIKATKWPERETVADASQGVQLATMQKLARYWATEYDWRKCEAKLNALPHFITEIDGLDIHFIHVRSKHENALPLIVTHGWPGSVIEQLKIIDPLTNPTAHGGSASDAFHLVIPSMPGYGFSGKPTRAGLGAGAHRTRLDRADEAPRIHEIRGARRRLGCAYRRPDGGAGASGIARHPHQHGRRGSTRNRQGGLYRGAAAIRPLGRGEACVRPARLLLHARPRLRSGDGEPPADAVRDCRFTRRPGRLDTRPRHTAATSSSHASSTVNPRA